MKLEQQVTSLALSQRLKKLGVKQEALFYYSRVNLSGKYELDFGIRGPWETIDTEHAIAAFTVAELGEMLPKSIFSTKTDSEEFPWRCENVGRNGYVSASGGKTEAEARGLMLQYLIENGLLKV